MPLVFEELHKAIPFCGFSSVLFVKSYCSSSSSWFGQPLAFKYEFKCFKSDKSNFQINPKTNEQPVFGTIWSLFINLQPVPSQ